MTTAAWKRDMRIQSLFEKADKGRYTKDGKFSMIALINDAKAIGVHTKTAEDYADVVLQMLKKAGHFK